MTYPLGAGQNQPVPSREPFIGQIAKRSSDRSPPLMLGECDFQPAALSQYQCDSSDASSLLVAKRSMCLCC